jgi:hypothetical protein
LRIRTNNTTVIAPRALPWMTPLHISPNWALSPAGTVDARVRRLISVNGPFKGHPRAVKGVIGPKKTIFLYSTEKRRKPLTDKALGLPKSLWRLLEALAWARLTA